MDCTEIRARKGNKMKKDVVCSFCERTAGMRLICGPSGNICDGCVVRAGQVLGLSTAIMEDYKESLGELACEIIRLRSEGFEIKEIVSCLRDFS